MAELGAAGFLSGSVTATDVEKLKRNKLTLVAKHLSEELQMQGKAKADMQAFALQALTEHNMLKCSEKPKELTEMQFQVEMKGLEKEEREKRTEREYDREEDEKQRELG